MTQEQVKRWLPEITALAEGKTIQVKNTNEIWYDTYDPSFSLMLKFRIKPLEPREFFVVSTGHHNVIYDSLEDAKMYSSAYGHKIIRVVEDLTWKPK